MAEICDNQYHAVLLLLGRRHASWLHAWPKYCRNLKLQGSKAAAILEHMFNRAVLCRVSTNTYSKGKYVSVISQAGGWAWFQQLLTVLDGIAKKHSVDIATVSSRWVLDQPQVCCCLQQDMQCTASAASLLSLCPLWNRDMAISAACKGRPDSDKAASCEHDVCTLCCSWRRHDWPERCPEECAASVLRWLASLWAPGMPSTCSSTRSSSASAWMRRTAGRLMRWLPRACSPAVTATPGSGAAPLHDARHQRLFSFNLF